MTGTICAVAVCKSNSVVASKTGQKISFFRFPKDSKFRNEWVRRCFKKDVFDPTHKRICSRHFTTADFEDAIHASIMNKLPTKLKFNAIPSQHLLAPKTNTPPSVVKTVRAKRLKRKGQEDLITVLLKPSSASPAVFKKTKIENPLGTKKQSDSFSEENKELKTQLEAANGTIKTLEQKIIDLQNRLENKNEEFSRRVKTDLSHIFTENEIDVMLKKKTHVQWTNEEISKACTLRNLSKRAYMYMRQELHYPLPPISTLQRGAMDIDLRNGH